MGNECVSCHRTDYNSSTNPNHVQAGFLANCEECHDAFTPGWGTDHVKHDFFPLTKGHDISDCAQCHLGGNFTDTPTSCAACHQPDYQAAVNPNHVQANFSNDCASCHTTDPGWTPAKYAQHDAEYFPIYSGKHQGQWMECVECHLNPANFAEFTCTTCHVNPETDQNHSSINGYVYESSACLVCHPTGDANGAFDHSLTNFPLTGAHLTAECNQCHANGYAGTPTQCSACHTPDYNASSNPNHSALNFPTDCAMCHTTDPGWTPATFPIHNNYYVLNGAHAVVANDCAACHNGDYNNTPNTCAGCHTPDYNATTNPNHMAAQFPMDCASCHSETAWAPSTFNHNTIYPLNGAHAVIANDCAACHHGDYNNTPNTCAGCHTPDYNATMNPNHSALQFSTDCATCHTETAWTPATFDHDGQYFPIYSGKHQGQWNACADCHTNPSNYAEFTCVSCHANPETDNQHNGIGGYTYQSSACLACHPTGDASAGFDHNTTNFPLTGAHLNVNCVECHANGYAGTPTQCSACHTPDFNSSTNPNHVALAIPMDCALCHTTAPGWAPATFPIHNNYYALNGAHALIASDCATCHNGNYNNTPNTCFECHTADYNGATNPKHASAGFPKTCEDCHSENAWEPSSFNHDQQYFPIYSGKHKGEWSQCIDCHTTPGNFAAFSCIDCHEHDNPSQLANDHQGVGGYQYSSPACLNCHPNGN